MSQDDQKSDKRVVFPAKQSDPNVFRQEDPNQASRMLTPGSQGKTVNLRPGGSGSGGIRSEARQTIDRLSSFASNTSRATTARSKVYSFSLGSRCQHS